MRVTILILLTLLLPGLAAGPAAAQDADQPADAPEVITIFQSAAVEYDAEWLDPFPRDDLTVLEKGQIIQKTVKLPALPANQRDARRIVANIHIQPVTTVVDGRTRPGDPWTRIASLTLVTGRPDTPDEPAAAEEDPPADPASVELMRFITGFGGEGTFEQDVTSLAPLLTGEVTFRFYISTYLKPGWEVTVTLTFQREGVGFRRPVFAEPLAFDDSVTAETSLLKRKIRIPEGLDQPRIRIISTGHASDGRAGDEFISRTHILRIDGEEVARFRPWREDGGPLRPLNPTSGRIEVEGRSLWSSDLDRAGWHPATRVEPLIVPVPELTPGEHEIELEILDIRPMGVDGGHGYWRLSAIIVADEPWPDF